MNGIYFKVNKGQYKNYMNGSYAEVKKAADELEVRATSKGYKMVGRKQGTGGVFLIYSNGKNKVEIVYVYSQNDVEWLEFFNKCQA